MNIYVGNLPYQAEKEELQTLFEEFGQVESVDIIVDRRSGRSRGYGFVSMSNDADSQSAVEALNGEEFGGRNLRVDISRPKERSQNRSRSHSNQSNNNANNPAQTAVEENPVAKKPTGLFGKIKGLFS